ncbi:hypothetical protein C0Q70_16514 [Pomacea canaliculata]|uniref:Uncharacterized protein n=1 Tax=Pomacea canaliculata TaxID=400727 RepID=A0A2T7NQ02_POMCA|nr:uncharacterized protein C8orf76-like [Pomacea canaliculata]PVD23250.1 hypothetical protein C0Q70_16514 [Pomacea canaliculata]
MDLDLAFDDSDFQRKEELKVGQSTSYNVKMCTELWFERDPDEEDTEYRIQQLKFSGDYNYFQGNFEAATFKYQELLDLLPANNFPVRQDVEESLSRCYMKLNRHKESIQTAQKLVDMMKVYDEAKQRQSLILFSQVCKCAKDWPGCITALEQLAHHQSHYAQFWLDLANAYYQYSHSEGESISYNFQVRIVTCYIRARLLLESVLNTVGQMTKERNQKLIAEIDQELSHLNVSSELIDQAAEITRADIECQDALSTNGDEEDIEEKQKEKEKFCEEAFFKRWFSWAGKGLP